VNLIEYSFSRKKRGHKPTGILVYTAKENGFCSVSELLQIKGSENLNHNKDVKANDGSSKSASSYKVWKCLLMMVLCYDY